MAKKNWRNAGGTMTKFRKAHETAYPERYETPVPRNMSPGQYYRAMGYQDHPVEGPGSEQGVLFPHPHGLQNPPRWEDLTPQQRSSTLKSVAEYGVTPESAHRAFGAQLDQAMHEEDGQHESFYGATGVTQSGGPAPRQVLLNTMRDTKRPFHEVVAAHSITSPQVRFASRSALGRPTLPNDDAARAVLRNEAAGKSGADWRAGRGVGAKPRTALGANVAKAIDMIRASRGGTSFQESGLLKDAPKVRAYHNALLDPSSPEGNYFVSDRHSGVPGFAPHLEGTAHADSYIRIANVHAFHDKIARDVLAERGLTGQVNRGQSAQWTQQKASKGQVQDVMDVTRAAQQPEETPSPRNVSGAQFKQMGLF